MKRYLKSPEEVTAALKEGKVVLDRTGNKYKSINGFIVVSYISGGWEVYPFVGNQEGLYVDEPKQLKLEVGKFYKTRNGKKAFVYGNIGDAYPYPFYVVVLERLNAYTVNAKGLATSEKMLLDLVAPWED